MAKSRWHLLGSVTWRTLSTRRARQNKSVSADHGRLFTLVEGGSVQEDQRWISCTLTYREESCKNIFLTATRHSPGTDTLLVGCQILHLPRKSRLRTLVCSAAATKSCLWGMVCQLWLLEYNGCWVSLNCFLNAFFQRICPREDDVSLTRNAFLA